MNLAEEAKIIANEIQDFFKTSPKELKISDDLLFFIPKIEIYEEKDGKLVNYHQFNEKCSKEVSITDLLNLLNLLISPPQDFAYKEIIKSKPLKIDKKWLSEKGQKKLKRLEELKNKEIISENEYQEKFVYLSKKYNTKLENLTKEKVIFGYKYFKTHVNLQEKDSLTKFLLDFYQDNCPLLNILKLCSKNLITNFMEHISDLLSNFSKIKSQYCLDDPWKIEIIKHHTKDNKEYISIKHSRKEKCFIMKEKNKTSNEMFDFAWNIEISFENLKCEKLLSFKAQVGEIEWKATKDEKIEKKFISLWTNPTYYFIGDMNNTSKKPNFCTMM